MAEIKSAIIPSTRDTYTDAPLIWEELSALEQAEYAGGQYESLSTWELAKQVSTEDAETAEVYDHGTTPLTGDVRVDGWTNATCNITIKAALNNYASGVKGNGVKLKTSQTEIALFYVREDFVTVQGFDVDLDGSSKHGVYTVGSLTASGDVKFEDCVFHNSTNNGALTDSVGKTTFARCVFTNCNRAVNGATADKTKTVVDRCVAYGNTQYGFLYVTGINSISLSNPTNDFYDCDASSDYNVASNTSAPGSNVVNSFDHSTLFPNIATGDFTPAIAYTTAFATTWNAGAVPWEEISIVDPNSENTNRDYESIEAWVAGVQGGSLVDGDIAIADCQRQGALKDITAVNITSLPTGVIPKVIVNEAYRHEGKWADTRDSDGNYIYRLEANNVDGLSTSIDGTVVDFICIKAIRDTSGVTSGLKSSTDNLTITFNNCIVKGESSNGGVANGYYGSGSNSVYNLNNCIGFGCGTGAYNSYRTFYINNCTFVGCDTGIGPYGYCIVTNTCVANCATGFTGSTFTGSTNNISSDGSAPDNSTTYTVYDAATQTLPAYQEDCVIFKDIANGDFRLVPHTVYANDGTAEECNSAIGNGTFLTDNRTDCVGQNRHLDSFDIGADQAPREIVWMVDTDGVVPNSYSGLQAAITASMSAARTATFFPEGEDLVQANYKYKYLCHATYGSADSTGVEFASTLGTSRECNIVAEAAEGHYPEIGTFEDTKYRVVQPGNNGYLYLNTPYITLNYLQVDMLGIDWRAGIVQGAGALDTDGLPNISINYCTVKGYSAKPNSSGININQYNGRAEVKFCTVIEAGMRGITSSRHDIVENNIAYGCGEHGFYAGCYSSDDSSLKNNISIGNGTDFFANQPSGSKEDYNVSSDATVPGTNASTLNNSVATIYFKDPDNGDFRPAQSAGLFAGGLITKTVGAVPYVQEKTVDPNGGSDYTSLSAWEAACQDDLVDSETAKAVCKRVDTAKDITATVISGWNTGVIPHITVHEDYRHEGKYADVRDADGNHVYIQAENINVQTPNTIIQHLLSEISLTTGGAIIVGTTAAEGLYIDSVLAYFTNPVSDYRQCLLNVNQNINCVLTNSIGINCGIGVRAKYLSGTLVEIYNNTFYSSSNSTDSQIVATDANTITGKNNAVFCTGTQSCYSSANFDSNSDYNVSSDTTAPGTNSVINQTDYANYFVDKDNGDFRLKDASINLWGTHGKNLSGLFTDAIDGTTRTHWDIGAFELTTIEKTVDPNGGSDYLNIQAWNDGEKGKYAAGDTAIAVCKRTGVFKDEVSATLDGWNSGVAIQVIAHANHMHEGIDSDTRASDGNYIYIMSIGNGDALHTKVPNTIINGLVVKNAPTSDWKRCVWFDRANGVVSNCIISASGTGSNCGGINSELIPTGTTLKILNNIISGINGHGIYAYSVDEPGIYIYNNTVLNCSDIGIATSYNDGVAINNLSIGNVTSDFNASGWNAACSNNISSDATAPGPNSIHNVIVKSFVEDA